MAGLGACQRGWRHRFGAPAGPGIHHFDRLFALPMPHDWASVPPPLASPSSRQGFCMTSPFPETKTGLRFGLAPLALTGCLAAVLAFAPVLSRPAPAEDNPGLGKANAPEIDQRTHAL